jgi:hypothetical protein
MILLARIHGAYRYAETWPEMVELIEEVMNNLPTEDPSSPWIVPGNTAQLCFVDTRRLDPDPSWGDNYLAVAVNAKTGYGGLTWCFTSEREVPADDEVGNHVWLSDNPEPPAFDPRVVSDPCYPIFYNPESTLPAAQVRAALEEFCRTATGDRPSCIGWIKGDVAGRRVDAEPNIGIKRQPPDAAAASTTGHTWGTGGHEMSAKYAEDCDPWSTPSAE